MSGIYISGVDITDKPRTLIFYNNGLVSDVYTGQRFKAIHVHDHGRLGDLDALAECIRTEGKNQAEQLADRHHPVVMAYGDCYGKCKAAPTIVPTDKEADI